MALTDRVLMPVRGAGQVFLNPLLPGTGEEMLQGPQGVLRRIPGVLPAAVCLRLIAELERTGFASTAQLYPPSYRNNDRLVFEDPALAARLATALAPHLPGRLGEAALVGLNPRFRSCRYRHGQAFCRHRDGVYYQSRTVYSRLTFMIYLNDASDFVGGRTRFYADRNSRQPLFAIQPQAGDLLVFSHDLWHDGEAVTAGSKYVLRSDILYDHSTRADRLPDRETDSQHPLVKRQAIVHAGYIWKVCSLGQGCASGGRDGRIHIEVPGGSPYDLRGHRLSVTALTAVSENGLWSGSRDQTLKIWHRQKGTWQCHRHWQGHRGAVLALTPLRGPSGEVIGVASGGADGQIHFWDLAGEWQQSLDGPGGWVWDLSQSPQGDLIAAAETGQIQISRWGKVLARLQTDVPQRALAAGPNGEILSGGADGQIRRWSANRLQSAWQAHQGAVRALALLPDGRLASGGEDDQVRIWNGATCLEMIPHGDFVSSLALTARGQLVSGAYDSCLRWFRRGL